MFSYSVRRKHEIIREANIDDTERETEYQSRNAVAVIVDNRREGYLDKIFVDSIEARVVKRMFSNTLANKNIF